MHYWEDSDMFMDDWDGTLGALGFTGSDEMRSISFVGVKYETHLAWLLQLKDGIDYWFPKSKCVIESEGFDGGIIRVPEWLLEEKRIDK